MPQCPQCQKPFVELPRQCPTCMADLDLLVDYVHHLHNGLVQADRHTRSGHLAEAVWAYLSVLEVDPDNPVARRQVGQIATAVRQFDRSTSRRQWTESIRRKIPNGRTVAMWPTSLRVGSMLLLLIAVFLLGFAFGMFSATNDTGKPPLPQRGDDSLMGRS